MHNWLVSYHMSDSMILHSRENSYELINQYWVCPNIWYMGLLILNKKYGKVTFHTFVDISEGFIQTLRNASKGDGVSTA